LSTMGCGMVEYLQRKGLSVRAEPMTAVLKTAAFAAVRARLNLGAVELYEQPDLLAEFAKAQGLIQGGLGWGGEPACRWLAW